MTALNNPYEAPDSSLITPTKEEWGSIDKALSGDYDLGIREVMGEAWSLTKGVKRKLWLGFLIYFVVLVAATTVLGFIFELFGESKVALVLSSTLNQMIIMIIIYPLIAGIFMMGIFRSVGRPISINMIFNNWSKTIPLFLSYLLVTIFVVFGFILLVIPGIYLSIAYIMVMPLIVDKNMGVWESLETSRKAVTKKWFKLFGLFICMGIIVLISILPFGIGLIWSVPWSVLVVAVAYRNIFGVQS